MLPAEDASQCVPSLEKLLDPWCGRLGRLKMLYQSNLSSELPDFDINSNFP